MVYLPEWFFGEASPLLPNWPELRAITSFYNGLDANAQKDIVASFAPMLRTAVETHNSDPLFDSLRALGLIDDHGVEFFATLMNGGENSWWSEIPNGQPLNTLLSVLAGVLDLNPHAIIVTWVAVGNPDTFLAMPTMHGNCVQITVISPPLPQDVIEAGNALVAQPVTV